ncbi:tyrosine-protein phosphatase [Flavobacterium sp. RSSB_23]|uniref:tyrosine-protein phosphatase n=1 Tax=Flavobacterium sp. RSSB_23 TaxID=3447668 RepID=UPI003F36C294
MLLFSSKKPLLRDLLPTNFVDIHSHLLYGIDDGATTPEHSIGLIREIKKLGFTKSITTPHVIQYVWENTPEKIINRWQETKHLLDNNESYPLQVAAEYLMDESFLKKIQQEKLLCLRDNYILVEMSYLNPPIQLYDILFELQINGYKPILAHPERYLFYHKNPNEFQKLKKAGCLFQLNLLSTVGYYGSDITKTADDLLQQNAYDFAGSDIHHEKHIASFNLPIKIKKQQILEQVIANNQFFDF